MTLPSLYECLFYWFFGEVLSLFLFQKGVSTQSLFNEYFYREIENNLFLLSSTSCICNTNTLTGLYDENKQSSFSGKRHSNHLLSKNTPAMVGIPMDQKDLPRSDRSGFASHRHLHISFAAPYSYSELTIDIANEEESD
jgi:hypothetical protein